MPKITQSEQLPPDAKVIQFGTGQFEPLAVAGKDIERVVIGYSAKTAANDRCAKRGPRFFMVRGRPYYRLKDLKDFFFSNPVETGQ